MVEPRISSIGAAQELRAVEKQKIQAAQSEFANEDVEQVVTERNLEEWCEEGFNPVAMTRRFQTLEETQKPKGKGKPESARAESEENESFVEEIQKIEEAANRAQQNNDELRKQILILLRGSISDQDSTEEILRKVLNFYPDFSLADEAIDYLLETSTGELFEKVRQAKEQLNSSYAREILAGRNISRQAKLFSNQGLGSPTALRDMYRDITGNPRSPNALFKQLTATYDFEKMRTVIRFLLHSLGADLKSKGPSIAREELLRLLEETRVLQGILGVFRFFHSRMKLLHSLFEKNDLTFPSRINFEILAKQFMGLLEERYITPDKILQIARKLGLAEELIAQIIVINQMRDAVRQIAPRLYKNQQQKDDLLNAFLETLEELEEDLEEEEKEEEKRQKKKKG
jgi:type III secretion protein W